MAARDTPSHTYFKWEMQKSYLIFFWIGDNERNESPIWIAFHFVGHVLEADIKTSGKRKSSSCSYCFSSPRRYFVELRSIFFYYSLFAANNSVVSFVCIGDNWEQFDDGIFHTFWISNHFAFCIQKMCSACVVTDNATNVSIYDVFFFNFSSFLRRWNMKSCLPFYVSEYTTMQLMQRLNSLLKQNFICVYFFVDTMSTTDSRDAFQKSIYSNKMCYGFFDAEKWCRDKKKKLAQGNDSQRENGFCFLIKHSLARFFFRFRANP